MAIVVALLSTALIGGSARTSASAGPAPTDWLGEVNLLRSMSGLPTVREEPSWSARNVEHARWMVYNDIIMHGAVPGTPWYSPSADLAGQRSNLSVSTAQRSDRSAIDGWMSVPFHGLGIIDPRLERVGFGAFYDPADGGYRWGGGLDVISGLDGQASTVPVVWPAHGATTHLAHYGGAEYPDPLTSCPAVSPQGAGVPLYALFPSSAGSLSVTSLQRLSDGSNLPLCAFDWTSYVNPDPDAQSLGRAVLAGRNAVIVMALAPLEAGQSYRLRVTRGGVTAVSTFAVGHEGAPAALAPVGSFERADPVSGGVRVAGWAADWSSPAAPVTIHAYVDGVGHNLGPAGLGRADVAATWPDLGPAHGFDATVPAAPGRHQVCAYAIGIGPGGSTQLGCREVVVTDPAPIGSLEVLSSPTPGRLRVAGWAADATAPTSPVSIRLALDGAVIDLGPASTPRADVAAARPDMGPNHSFDVTIDATPGAHQACVTALGIGAGGDRPFGCRQVWVADPASPFWDVLSTATFFDDITWMLDRGVTTGGADGSFRPGSAVLRQEMAAFLQRFDGAPSTACTAAPFTDVAASDPFCPSISWLVAQGVTSGIGGGAFGGRSPVTRAQMAVFLYRLANGVDIPPTACTAAPFPDVAAADPFCPYIAWLSGTGITTGGADGRYHAGRAVQRDVMAAFLHRLELWLA